MAPKTTSIRSRSTRASATSVESNPTNLPLSIFTWGGRVVVVGILVLCPWLYGSVTWTAQTWVVPAVGLAFLFAIAVILIEFFQSTQRKTLAVLGSPFLLSLWCLLILALFQSVALPKFVWDAVAPAAAFERRVEALAGYYEDTAAKEDSATGEAILPTPTTLSIDPAQTKASASVFAAALAMLVSAGVLFRGQLGNLLLLTTIVVTVLSNTILGLFQTIVWNGWTLLEMPSEVYFATFVSRNSAPQFIAIGMAAAIGLLAWWTKSKNGNEAEKRYHVRYPAVNAVARLRRRMEELLQDLDFVSIVLVFTITFMLVGVIAAASRGGILACVFAVCVTLAVTLGKKKEALIRALALFALVGFVAVLLLTSLNLETVAIERLNTISAEAHQLNNGRLDVWKLALTEPSYWLAGCGLGTFHFGILPCYDGTEAVWFYHAENIFVELFTEFGFAGFLIGVAGVASLFAQIFKERGKSSRNPALFPAVVFALSAVTLQSMVDFSLIIPAVFLPLAAVVGCFVGELSSGSKSGRVRSARTSSPTVRPVFWQLPAVQFFGVAIIFSAMLYGNSSLRGYAAAENLAQQLKAWNEASTDGAFELPDVEFTPQLLQHPEFALQLARLEQSVFETEFKRSKAWSADTPMKLRASFSAPETVAAAVRGGLQGKLAAFGEILAQEPKLMEQLAATRARMELAAGESPLDWRPSWGILRSDFGELSTVARNKVYARLAFTTKHHPRLAQSIGTTAFLAGERSIGIDLWRRTLAANPNQSTRLAELAGELIDGQALNELLPDLPLLRIKLARTLLEKRPAGNENSSELLKDVAQSILPKTEIAEISGLASSSQDWRVVGWFAEQSGAIDVAIECYREATRKASQDHALRFKFAKMLESQGLVDEAIAQMHQACLSSPINSSYALYLKELEETD